MCPANHLAPLGRAALLAEEGLAFDSVRAHFLIVDDISSMRRVIGALLREQLRNIRISEAADGAGALQLIQAAGGFQWDDP